MRRVVLVLLLPLATPAAAQTAPTVAEAESPPGVRYEDELPPPVEHTPSSLVAGASLEWLLIRDKVGLAPRFVVRGKHFGVHLDFGLIYTTEDDPSGVLDGSWVGSLLSIHPMGRIPVSSTIDVRAGTGLDFFFLWGVNWGEWQLGVPAVLEVDVELARPLVWYAQSRIYLLQTDGLEVGVDRAGEATAPVLLTTGLGGEW